MCTVSWIHNGAGYHLLCNRDERHTRARAHHPAFGESQGIRFVAPVDGDHGGTWIAANEHGITLCLLNGANVSCLDSPRARPPLRSRGLIIPELIGASSLQEVCDLAWNMDVAPYAPFTLAVLEPGMPAAVVEWSGVEKIILPYGDPYMPLFSSSFHAQSVRARRQRYYSSMIVEPTPAALRQFHASHGDGAGPYSPCMHRADARTVSFTEVAVDAGEVLLAYTPGAPCDGAPAVTAALPRVN